MWPWWCAGKWLATAAMRVPVLQGREKRKKWEREGEGRALGFLLSKADECDCGGTMRARKRATRWLNPTLVGHHGEVRLAIRAPLAD
jgi:hypothetical protein